MMSMFNLEKLEAHFGISLPLKYKDFFNSNRPAEYNGKLLKNDDKVYFKQELLIYCFNGGTYDVNYFFYDNDELRYLPFATYTSKKYDSDGYDDEGGFVFMAVDIFDEKLPILEIDISGGEIMQTQLCDSIDEFESLIISKEDAKVEKQLKKLFSKIYKLLKNNEIEIAARKWTNFKKSSTRIHTSLMTPSGRMYEPCMQVYC